MTDATPEYGGPRRILSGIQASGALHLGNYLGALKRFVALQDAAPTFVFVADLHAITVWQDPAVLTAQTHRCLQQNGFAPQKSCSRIDRGEQ